ncbi:uncharacterized protein LOC117390010 [Periophthalmus magnuspinnatus]|uniref:uncharacterized protein LOC117390010 n=1 Tax=Periophthalmus magnuspinnatus TaxID=409849 RepID=UPI0024365540|nr:uncharacterized protein LOC117390010 [Periophthalmus magnuspinnatus]
MAALWTVMVLALFLSAPLSEAVVNKNDLARFVNDLLNVYKPTYQVHEDAPMFSLAISIPLNAIRRHDFSLVTAADPPQNVRSALNRCQVYTGARVVGATLLKYPDFMRQCPNEPVSWDYVTRSCPAVRYWRDFEQCTSGDIRRLKREVDGLVQHAEYRVLQNFQHLTNKINRGIQSTDLMLFYIYKSPCSTRCCSTDHLFSIINKMTSVRRWNNYAVVFSHIFVPGHTSASAATLEQDRRTALMNLGNGINGIANIYRCTPGASTCFSCNAPGGVNNDCVRAPRSPSAPPGGH